MSSATVTICLELEVGISFEYQLDERLYFAFRAYPTEIDVSEIKDADEGIPKWLRNKILASHNAIILDKCQSVIDEERNKLRYYRELAWLKGV